MPFGGVCIESSRKLNHPWGWGRKLRAVEFFLRDLYTIYVVSKVLPVVLAVSELRAGYLETKFLESLGDLFSTGCERRWEMH